MQQEGAKKYQILHQQESKKMSDNKIKIILTKSIIGCQKDQIATVRGLGLKKINSFVIREKNPETIGMVKKVGHLILTEEL